MAIREFMGLDVPAFKRFYKDSKKNNMQMKDRCYWAEKDGDKARFPELVQQFMKTVSCKRFTIS